MLKWSTHLNFSVGSAIDRPIDCVFLVSCSKQIEYIGDKIPQTYMGKCKYTHIPNQFGGYVYCLLRRAMCYCRAKNLVSTVCVFVASPQTLSIVGAHDCRDPNQPTSQIAET